MLKNLYEPLYAAKPSSELFHYTSIDSLLGIVSSKVLWATEISYLNDSQELRYFTNLMKEKLMTYDVVGNGAEIDAAGQLSSWINDWFIGGALVFTTSFTENGNVLSQWRGYCRHGRGVSLGFDPATIVAFAGQADFAVARCVYDWQQHHQLARDVVSSLVKMALENGPDTQKHPSQSYFTTFQAAANDVIRIAALAKHPSFAEEEEWRCISQPFTNYVEAPIKYRAGASALVPYIEFPLPELNDALAIQTAVVGPSATPDLAINGVSQFLAKYAQTGQQRTIRACGIPYRE